MGLKKSRNFVECLASWFLPDCGWIDSQSSAPRAYLETARLPGFDCTKSQRSCCEGSPETSPSASPGWTHAQTSRFPGDFAVRPNKKSSSLVIIVPVCIHVFRWFLGYWEWLSGTNRPPRKHLWRFEDRVSRHSGRTTFCSRWFQESGRVKVLMLRGKVTPSKLCLNLIPKTKFWRPSGNFTSPGKRHVRAGYWWEREGFATKEWGELGNCHIC